jgi:hypothetical protein
MWIAIETEVLIGPYCEWRVREERDWPMGKD